MNSTIIIYQTLRAAYVDSERRLMAGILTDEEAEQILDDVIRELSEESDEECFDPAFERFSDDLSALGWLLWLSGCWQIGPLLSWMASWFVSVERRERVALIAEDLGREVLVQVENETGVN